MKRRLHSSTLGGSRKWAALQTDSARMLYERLIDLTDPYGNVDADPIMVKANAIPRLMTSVEDVAEYLDDMERVGLIERWEVDNNPYLHIVDFEAWNTIDPAKEAQTLIPGPDGIVPQRPPRQDRGKPAKRPTRKPKKAEPDDGEAHPQTRADPGQTQGKPRAGNGLADKDKDKELDREKTSPPTPPQAVSAPPEDEEDLTPHQKWQRDKPPDPLPASRLAAHHPQAWSALTDFKRSVPTTTPGQFTAWAQTVEEHVRAHGEQTVVDALHLTREKTGLKQPFAYYRKLVENPKPKAGEAVEYREVTAAEWLEGSWN